MYIFLIIVHVIVCLVLIAVILLQAGRGGGLSGMAGGSQTQSILGTQTNTFMTRATEACAIIFIITSLVLGVLSTQRGKSLIAKERMMHALKANLPPASVATQAEKKGEEAAQTAVKEIAGAAKPAETAQAPAAVEAQPAPAPAVAPKPVNADQK